MTHRPVSDLPVFKYHPDPVVTGSFIPSDTMCRACEFQTGWIYIGPTYSQEELDEAICPWCIADGTAHEKFNVEFLDPPALGDYGSWSPVPQSVLEEICYRTPAFNGFQQERWFTHCNDGAIFLGCAGKSELENLGSEAIETIKLESGYTDEEWEDYFSQMDKDFGPTAYLFRCCHCGTLGGYSDCA